MAAAAWWLGVLDGAASADEPAAVARVPLESGGAVEGVVVSFGREGLVLRRRAAQGGEDGGLVTVSLEVLGSPRARGNAELMGVLRGLDRDVALLVEAERLWRAASRLERGDWRAAEPVFEAAAEEGGPARRLVQEGLLRSGLQRGVTLSAVKAWITAVSAREVNGIGGGVEVTVPEPLSAPAVRPWDEATGLCPALPPVFLGDGVQASTVRSAAWSRLIEAAGDSGTLARWYGAAVLFESGDRAAASEMISGAAASDALKESAGVQFVREIVTARLGDPAQRDGARGALEARLAGLMDDTRDDWREAWIRAGLGRSLLREDDAAARERGVLHLLHVPARLSGATPGLAAVCLAEAAVELRRAEHGDAAGAEALLAELRSTYAEHPALEWTGAFEGEGGRAAESGGGLGGNGGGGGGGGG